jgi:hypothetical protein
MTTLSESFTSEQNTDLSSSIKELLSEVREQRHEINSLKDEVRGNSLSLKSEVKRFKCEQDFKWRFEGNKIQHQFNTELFENLSQVIWALENGKQDYARELVNECSESLKKRNKHIRIADSSEGGWDTVRMYESNPLASDSEDESRISRAESRAMKRKKSMQKTKKRFRPSATATSDSQRSSVGNMFSFPGQQQQQQQQQQWQTPFRHSSFNSSFRGGALGPCFACGESTHFRRNCPYTRYAQQPDIPAKK